MAQENPQIEELVVEPITNLFRLNLKEVWDYRELLFFFVWRDIAVRYKQTLLGVAWVILQPLLTMVIFSTIFGRLAKLPSDGIPYPIFTFTALLPWQLFSRGVSDATNSLVGNQAMVTKTYFPRIILLVSSVVSGLVDFFLSLVVLFGMMIFYKEPFTWRLFLLPVLILVVVLTAIAVGLWLSVFNVQYRDVKYAVPFLMQFWQYASPIAYSISLIPEAWHWFYGLNPMAGVIDGFRWVLLGQNYSLSVSIIPSLMIVILLLLGGLVFFQHHERKFADMI